MDIQKIIKDVASKLTGNNDLIKKFTSDPAAIIKQLTGIEVTPDKIAEIVKGVKELLGGNLSESLKDSKSLLDKIKGLFKKL